MFIYKSTAVYINRYVRKSAMLSFFWPFSNLKIQIRTENPVTVSFLASNSEMQLCKEI